jgi:outer membrane protein
VRNCFFALLCALCVLASSCPSPACAAEAALDLQSVIDFALKHNASLRISEKNILAEKYGIDAAKAERWPRVDFGTGVTYYRYPTPLTPVVIQLPLTNVDLPNFEETIYDVGASFKLPLYRGGRIARNIRIAETRKGVAEDNYAWSRQDLIYNLTSVYHKILQLRRLLVSARASVTQLEGHERNVSEFLRVGTVPRLDLLKTEVELAHARRNVIEVKNNLDSVFELLKNLMGIDDPNLSLSIADEPGPWEAPPTEEEATNAALAARPDYRALAKRKKIAEERIKLAWGRQLPDVYGSGQYVKRAGESTSLREDWSVGLRLTIPVFDGGLIRADVAGARVELEKVKEEERALRQSISREVKDAILGVANASERIGVAEKALASARESLRVERLKYETGAGTSTDVIDAQTALLRAETDYYQAGYDRETNLALLKKAMGAHFPGEATPSREEVSR